MVSPFSPRSTASPSTSPPPGPPSISPKTGAAIPIEQGSPSEVRDHAGKQLTANHVGVWNPAFDVTPAKYVTAIITERGVLRAPYAESLERLSHEAAVLA